MNFKPWLPGISGNVMNNPLITTVGVDGSSMDIIDLIYRTNEYIFGSDNRLANYDISNRAIDFEDVMTDIDFFINKRTLIEKLTITESMKSI
jgi:hypothetical protein